MTAKPSRGQKKALPLAVQLAPPMIDVTDLMLSHSNSVIVVWSGNDFSSTKKSPDSGVKPGHGDRLSEFISLLHRCPNHVVLVGSNATVWHEGEKWQSAFDVSINTLKYGINVVDISPFYQNMFNKKLNKNGLHFNASPAVVDNWRRMFEVVADFLDHGVVPRLWKAVALQHQMLEEVQANVAGMASLVAHFDKLRVKEKTRADVESVNKQVMDAAVEDDVRSVKSSTSGGASEIINFEGAGSASATPARAAICKGITFSNAEFRELEQADLDAALNTVQVDAPLQPVAPEVNVTCTIVKRAIYTQGDDGQTVREEVQFAQAVPTRSLDTDNAALEVLDTMLQGEDDDAVNEYHMAKQEEVGASMEQGTAAEGDGSAVATATSESEIIVDPNVMSPTTSTSPVEVVSQSVPSPSTPKAFQEKARRTRRLRHQRQLRRQRRQPHLPLGERSDCTERLRHTHRSHLPLQRRWLLQRHFSSQ